MQGMKETQVPGLGRSPGAGNGNPLQYFHLGNSMDRGTWQATVHYVCAVLSHVRLFATPWCLTSPALTGRFFTTSTTWEAQKSPRGQSIQ